MNKRPPFIHLRVHSAYSLLEGAIKCKALVARCVDQKTPAVAITDTNNLFGSYEFSQTTAESGVQPIIGCQIALKRPEEEKKNAFQAAVATQTDPLVLLVQNEEGYKNLLKLLEIAYLESPDGEGPHITFESLLGKSDGLIALTAGIQGGLAQFLLNRQKERAEQYLEQLKQLFPDRLYVEISRVGVSEEATTEEALIEIALKHNLPLVGTNEAFFLDADMHEAHDALTCVAEGTYVSEENRKRLTANQRFKTSDEMWTVFKDLPEAYLNTSVIARRCAYRPISVDPILPPYVSESGRAEEDELKHQAFQCLEQRLEKDVYDQEMPKEERLKVKKQYQDRLEYELGVINQMGYPGYFLIVADFIQWAKQNNIPVGPGRGSGAGSLVAWSLTITDVDPIRFSLIFERFLNPERVSMPDFDIDFCQERRDEVIRYVQQKYGHDHVAQIITFGKLQARAVLRDVGRVLQLPYPLVDKICKLVPNNPANPVTLQDAILIEPQLQEMQKDDPGIKKLIDIALKLEGLYRHASTHAAGVVIGDRPLSDFVALYRDPKSDMPVTQLNMKYVEQSGLVKFDFLGLKTLTVIEKTSELIGAQGEPFDISAISLEDSKTFDLLQNVETVGVFQLEGAGMRDVLRQLQPDRFEELIALVALYRPGPMDDIPRYLACRHGKEEIQYMHPKLEDILKETFGVMVYQEQVMQIAQVLAGYSLGGADLLRRAMGKKIKSEMDAQRQVFIEGAKERGVASKLAQDIFDKIAKFASYAFNKSHSAPYALLAYQTAFLKANYTVEFFAASMTADMHNTDKLTFFKQELDRMELKLLPPDVNHSLAQFSVEEDPSGTKAVRYALGAIKNVGAGAMEELVHDRSQNGPYKDILDFAGRLSTRVINKRNLEHLVAAGAFDQLHDNRRQLYDSIDFLIKYASEQAESRESVQVSLFEGDLQALPTPKLPVCELWDSLTQLRHEFGALGFYLSAHPLDGYGSTLSQLDIVESAELSEYLSNGEPRAFNLVGVVVGIKEKTAKSGNRYAFLQLTDTSGVYEITVFSEVLSESREILVPGMALFLGAQGRIESDMLRLTVQTLELLDDKTKNMSHEVTLHLSSETELERLCTILKPLKDQGRGTLRLFVSLQEALTSIPSPYQDNQETLTHVEILLDGKYALPSDLQEKVSG
ncbi:MAG: DNA polymerase III subunit alpha [Alphaproteobacteria bacterium]|jgi:DNA polymerase III subunit alpha|nr:DNA polymerase III subunit alpha [Alphaproteobacteria bacterium]MBT5390526.1 DNA polymerase III subunit alpha [Alphaproteobacteria bacterium]MBT5540360.1 DNA polymerase III subunit alpha [Alphaproteobacteria bacterium]MBT5654883.1 DNA polymerase III subunit alpha [Alphaproteobacteria bacterium]